MALGFIIALMFLASAYGQANYHCQTQNPAFGCFQIASQKISTANNNPLLYCTAVKEYIVCNEKVACDCKLGNNRFILQEIATYVEFFKRNGCPKVLQEELLTDPGIICPGDAANSSDADAALTILAFESLPQVILMEKNCTGIKKCYKELSVAAGLALYNKDLGAFCEAIETFLPCFENRTCACGENYNNGFIKTAANERKSYNSYCSIITNGVFFKEGIQCAGDTPVNVCKEQNPISDCFNAFQAVAIPQMTNKPVVCPAFHTYLNCTEGVACTCGLRKHVPILKGMAFAHENYKSMGCEAFSGKLERVAGIQCPAGSPNTGTASDEVLTTLGLLNAPAIIGHIGRCPASKECYIQSDKASAKALHEKDAPALCQAQSDFIHCWEQALCKCYMYMNREYQYWLTQQKAVHLQLCQADKSITPTYTCDSSAVLSVSVWSVLIFTIATILF